MASLNGQETSPPAAMAASGIRKMRDSCDLCNAKKIKCSKDKPSCTRCASKHVTCCYGMSQRTGRPPRDRSDTSGSIKAIAISKKKAMSKHDGQPSQIPIKTAYSQSASLENGTNAPSNSARPESTITGQHGAQEPFASFDDLFGDNMDMELPDAMYLQASLGQPWEENDDFTRSLDPDRSGHASSRNPSTASKSEQTPPAEASTNSTHETARAGDTKPTIHAHRGNCMDAIIQLTLDLHMPNSTCTGNAGQKFGTEHEPARDVDTVLLQTRKAIATLSECLDCSCPAALDVALATYLLASKIVGWYGAILGIFSTLSEPSTSGYDHVLLQPISLGNFILDAEALRSVQARVVLGEIRNYLWPVMEKLPRFQSRGSSADMRGEGFEMGKLDAWFAIDAQKCQLREQLSRLIAAASPSGTTKL